MSYGSKNGPLGPEKFGGDPVFKTEAELRAEGLGPELDRLLKAVLDQKPKKGKQEDISRETEPDVLLSNEPFPE